MQTIMLKINTFIVLSCLIITNNVLSTSIFSHQSKEEFAKDVLAVHNEHRKVHNGENSDLELSEELSKKAQEIADAAARDSDVLEEAGPGENFFMACSTYNRALTGREVTDSWYDEVCHPNFAFARPDNKQARSFTQVVWKNSKKLGVGHTVTRKEHTICTYAIAVYYPTGNVLDFFEGNVTKGSFKNDKYCKNPTDAMKAYANVALKHEKGAAEKSIRLSRGKALSRNSKSTGPTQFILNKNPAKPGVDRRTLYYKIPVNFITSVKTGSTYAVPLKPEAGKEATGTRRTVPSPHFQPETNTAAQTDAINYGYAYNEKADYGPTEESPRSSYGHVDNGDVQADYMSEKLAQTTDSMPTGTIKSNFYGGAEGYSDENLIPYLERIPMNKPFKKSIEDEYLLNKVTLKVHNALRKIHGVPALTLSAKMSIDAENYAKYLAENNIFEHAKNRGDDGENLAFSCNYEGRIPSVSKAIKDWYEEVCTKDYDFDIAAGRPETAHFSQIVWKSTKNLGIGRSIIRRGDKTCTYFVARYNPSGNWVGKYTDNVFAGSFTTNMCGNLGSLIATMASAPEEGIGEESTPSSENTVVGNKKPLQIAEEQPPTPTKVEGQVQPVYEEDKDQGPKQEQKKPVEVVAGVVPTKKPISVTNLKAPSLTVQGENNNCRFWSINEQSKFASESLKVHNYFRKLHNSPALEISADLIKQAYDGAKAICGFDNKRGDVAKAGENIETACNYDDARISAADAVTNWYREACDGNYNFENPEKGDSSKFTQLVWQSSKLFGTAFVSKKKANGMFCTYIVAKYSPSGNKPGAYKENVLKGAFTPSICNSLNTMANEAVTQVQHPVKIIQPQTVLQPQKAHPVKIHQPQTVLQPQKAHPPQPRIDSQGSFEKQVNSHIFDVALHDSTKFEPFKTPTEHVALHPNVLNAHHVGLAIARKSSCDKEGTKNPACKDKIEDKGFILHNKLRLIHKAEPLELSPQLSLEAEKIAQKLFEEKIIKPSSSGDGQSVVVKCRKSYTVEEAVRHWYNEVCSSKYDFAEEGTQAASHFTQLVWKSSKFLGIGKVSGQINGLFCTIVVAKYQPAGNILTKFRSNVLQGDFKREDCDSSNNWSSAGQTSQQNKANSSLEASDPNSPATNNISPIEEEPAKPTASAEKKPSDPKKVPSGTKIPKENKGINPKAGERKPAKTMPGETPSGAKQMKQKLKMSKLDKLIPKMPTIKEARDFNDESLKIHNALRVLHGSDKLTSSPDLVLKAAQIAKKSIRDGIVSQVKKNAIVDDFGQNTLILCDAVKTEYTPKQIIMKWYMDVCDSNSFIAGSYAGKPNHFTQIVWKASKLFGMARASFSTKEEQCTIAVAVYGEHGNYIGKVKDNVKQGSFDFDKCKSPDGILAEAEEKVKQVEVEANKVTPTTAKPLTTAKPASPGSSGSLDETGLPSAAPSGELKTSPTPMTVFTNPPDDARTTAVPVLTTKIPENANVEQTTAVPALTTKKPDNANVEQTTAMPVLTTKKPDNANVEGTTVVPALTTRKPENANVEQTTAVPVLTTKKPEPTQMPGGTTKAPATTKIPVASESKPDASGSQASEGGSDYETGGLNAHNAYRKIHDAEPLTLEKEMSESCAKYAKEIADLGRLKHSDSSDGENLAYACKSTELSAEEATRNWYNETCEYSYNFAPNAKNERTGHFTQLVWKGSTKLGIGRYMKKSGSNYCTYVVARYKPAGNWGGEYDKNVKKGSFDPDQTCTNVDKIAGINATKRTNISPTKKRANVETNKDIKKLRIVNEEEDDKKLASDSLTL